MMTTMTPELASQYEVAFAQVFAAEDQLSEGEAKLSALDAKGAHVEDVFAVMLRTAKAYKIAKAPKPRKTAKEK
jgi:hypothetical protein